MPEPHVLPLLKNIISVKFSEISFLKLIVIYVYTYLRRPQQESRLHLPHPDRVIL